MRDTEFPYQHIGERHTACDARLHGAPPPIEIHGDRHGSGAFGNGGPAGRDYERDKDSAESSVHAERSLAMKPGGAHATA